MKTRSLSFNVLPILLIGAARLEGQSAEPTALVVHVVPEVTILRGSDTLHAVVGLAIHAGDRLNVGRGGRAVIVRASGRSESVTAATTIAASSRPEPGTLMQSALTLFAQLSVDARMQPNRAAMIRPIAGAAVAIAPRNRITVLDARPTFTWFSAGAARTYTVQIGRAGAAPLRYSAIADTAWTLPATELPLLPGAEYEWSVTAGPDGRTGAVVAFRTISPEDLAKLTGRLKDMIAQGIDFEKEGLLLAATAYLEVGLVYDALHAIERLLASGVPLSPAVSQFHRALIDQTTLSK